MLFTGDDAVDAFLRIRLTRRLIDGDPLHESREIADELERRRGYSDARLSALSDRGLRIIKLLIKTKYRCTRRELLASRVTSLARQTTKRSVSLGFESRDTPCGAGATSAMRHWPVEELIGEARNELDLVLRITSGDATAITAISDELLCRRRNGTPLRQRYCDKGMRIIALIYRSRLHTKRRRDLALALVGIRREVRFCDDILARNESPERMFEK
jgi:hypothetical protein